MLKKYYIYKNEPNSYKITVFGKDSLEAISKFNELTNQNLKFVNKFESCKYVLEAFHNSKTYNLA